jgi:hypothetical protein
VGIRDRGPYPGVQRGFMAVFSRWSISRFCMASGSEFEVRDDEAAMVVWSSARKQNMAE